MSWGGSKSFIVETQEWKSLTPAQKQEWVNSLFGKHGEPPTEEIAHLPENANMLDVLVALGVFTSKGNARKNWKGALEIPSGYNDAKVSGNKWLITTFKLVQTYTYTEADGVDLDDAYYIAKQYGLFLSKDQMLRLLIEGFEDGFLVDEHLESNRFQLWSYLHMRFRARKYWRFYHRLVNTYKAEKEKIRRKLNRLVMNFIYTIGWG